MKLLIRVSVFILTVMGILIILYASYAIAATGRSSELSSLANDFFIFLAWISVGIAEIAVAWLLEKQLKKT